MSYEQALAALTGQGSPFETTVETVLGRPMPVFKNRFKSLLEVLEHSKSFGDQVFSVWDTGVRWTYAEHAQIVASVAAAFRERYGIGPGSRVGILAANCPEWVLSAWATIALGGTVVAMNGWWQGDEILYGLELGSPDLLVADRSSGTSPRSKPSLPAPPCPPTRSTRTRPPRSCSPAAPPVGRRERSAPTATTSPSCR
jgi:non-ribosomal peptide synthetase component F